MSQSARLILTAIVAVVITAGATLMVTRVASAQSRRTAECFDVGKFHEREAKAQITAAWMNKQITAGKANFALLGDSACAW